MVNPAQTQCSSDSAGFTLLELLVTITIVGIIMAIAVPSFQNTIQDSRRNAALSEFRESIQLARDEAVARNASLTLCASNDGSTCSNANTWEKGYVLRTASGGTLIKSNGALHGSQTLRATNGSSAIVFSSNGLIRTTDSFRLCDARGTAEQRGLTTEAGGARDAVNADAIGNCP